MRDYKRCSRILKLMSRSWRLDPDLRLCQLVVNMSGVNGDPYHVEDDVFEKNLQAYLDERLKAQRARMGK